MATHPSMARSSSRRGYGLTVRPSYLKHHRLSPYDRESIALAVIAAVSLIDSDGMVLVELQRGWHATKPKRSRGYRAMPRAAKACRKPHCPHFQPCPIPGHQAKAWEGSTRSKTLPPGWEKLRRQILLRDPICTECHNALSTEVHHKGDSDDHRPEMLAGICADCHGPISSRQGQAAQGQSQHRARRR